MGEGYFVATFGVNKTQSYRSLSRLRLFSQSSKLKLEILDWKRCKEIYTCWQWWLRGENGCGALDKKSIKYGQFWWT